jgi:hypothetical protein
VRFSGDFVLGFLYSGFLPAGPIKCLRDSLQRDLDLGGCTTLLKPNALISKVTFRKARFSANPVRQLMWTRFLVNLHRLLPEPAKDYSRVVGKQQGADVRMSESRSRFWRECPCAYHISSAFGAIQTIRFPIG